MKRKSSWILAAFCVSFLLAAVFVPLSTAQVATISRAPLLPKGLLSLPPRGMSAAVGASVKQAADEATASSGVISGSSYHNDISLPLRDMEPVLESPKLEKPPREANENPANPIIHKDSPDGAVQKLQVAEPKMPAPILNFDGIPFPGVVCNCAPPDTDGEVGATQFVQIVNEGLQVFDKTTGTSVFGPVAISTLWTGFGGPCETAGDGDPIVLYDQLANRWLVSQFAGASVPTDECIAISQTNDATGAYFRYGFHLGANFFDYPKIAVWPDAYYMAMNVFNSAGTVRLGPQPFAFDRAAMLAGNPGATFVTTGIFGGASEPLFSTADLDGSTLPAPGAPNTFVEWPGTGSYKIFHMHADFAVPANTTFTLFATIPAAPFTQLCPGTRVCVPQLGGTNADGIGDRIMHRLAYRNFGSHEAVVGNFSVLSGGVSGIRWFELDNVTAGPVTLAQESTYQPDTDWRWMGSAAMDTVGNMAIGFSASSPTIFPQIRYAGRLAGDPPNTLAQGETHLFDGTGSQTDTSSRWGDYSALTVDPVDDCTFWYTQQYYAVTSSFNWRTRIGNFKFANCSLHEHVTSTVPAVGSIVSVPPTAFTVNVSDPVDPTTLSLSDFTVNGIPPSSGSYTIGSTTINFGFAVSPVTAQGLQAMHVPAGAFTSTTGDPVVEFNGTFRYDALLLQVVSTNPPVGGTFHLPAPFTYDVNFNEPVDPSSVQAADLNLSGIAGSSVTGVTVLPGNTTARFTLSVPTEGALTASIAAGAINDQFGNPGAAFSGSYTVDIGTEPYPTPLSPKPPLGSLVYDPSISGVISPAGDTDSFTISLDPNQTITVLVTANVAGLQPTVTLTDPSSAVIASATAAAPGQNALIETAPAATAGTYTMTVGGAGGTTGAYTVQATLNAALEVEGNISGAHNDTLATAQDISSSFTTVSTSLASAQRGAVVGVTDNAGYGASAVAFTFEDISATGTVIAGLHNQDDTAVSIPIGFSFPFFGANQTTIFVSSNGLMTFGTGNTGFSNADLTTTPAQAGIAPFWDDLHTGGGVAGSDVYMQVLGSGASQHLTVQWNKVRFFSGGTAGDTITFEAQLYADGRIQLNYPDLVSGSAAGNNGASATVGLKNVGTQGPDRLLLCFNNGPNTFVGTGLSTLITPPNPTADYYSFSAGAGDVVTLAIKALPSGGLNLDLRNSADTVLASGVGGSTNLDSVISNFVIPAAGTYYARVTGATNVPYNLVVTRNAAFDTEANDTFATAQPLAGNKGYLGGIAPSGIYLANPVAFTFEDISGTGSVIGGLDGQDDASVSIPVGFTFPFYGTNNTTVFVSSNGLLSFGSGNTEFTNADMTSDPTQAAIAPFWDDQIVTGGANTHVFFQVLGSGPNQHLTIQWNQTTFFSGGTAGDTLTYEAQLYADGRIQFNYSDLVSGTAAGNNGGSATVGIKAAGTQGPNRLLLAFNNGPNAFVGTGKSTLISQPPSDDWYSLTVAPGQTVMQVETSTPGDGPGEFVNTLNPHIELYDPSAVLVASGTPLGDGRNESITAAVLTPGTYRIRVNGEGGTLGEYFMTARASSGVTSLSPAKMWVGLANSDDVGLRLDLQAEVFINATKIGQGGLNNVATGSSGFNNAILNTIPLTLFGPVPNTSGQQLSIKVSARRTCTGPGHASGRPRLWYNGKPIDSGATRDAGSRFDATNGGSNFDYFLRTGSALSTQSGTAKTSVDVLVDSTSACPARPFTAWGTWNITLP